MILLVSSITPVLIIGLIGATQARNVLEQQIGNDSLELARSTLERISGFLDLEFENVHSWSHVINLTKAADENSYASISEELAHLQEVQSEYYNIILQDKNGKIVASSSTELIGLNLSAETGFKEAIGGKPNIQDVAFNSTAGGWAIVISAPVKNSDEDSHVEAVISAVLKWEIINEMITSLQLAGQQQRESDHFMLINSEGTVISCYDRAELFTENLIKAGMDSAKYALEKKEGFLLENETEHGLESFSVYTYLKKHKNLPDFGWGLIILQDPDRVFASVNLLKRTTMYILAIFVVILSVVSLILANRITKPILAIAAAAINLGKGHLDTRVNVNSKDEIAQLAQSFNKMAENLKTSTTSIDRLNTVNQQLEASRQQIDVSNQQLKAENIERQRAEKNLTSANETLKQTVEKLALSNDELQEFVYIASHDLREPLRKISSFGELLKDSLSDSLGEDDQENLNYMVDGAERMTQMIEALLVYSRLNTKEITFNPVDLNKIIEQFKHLELAELLEETNATIDIPQTLPTVKADEVMIRELMQNLIGNGIKYQKPGTAPKIEITATQIDGENVRIEFRDNGIGIKKEMHGAIFKMFKRVHSRDKYKGAGIGLAVCKKIAERHGSQIGVDSQQDKGSVFWFTMLLEKESVAVS